MIRLPSVVEAMVPWLNRQVDVPCLRAAVVAADQLTAVDGFSPPSKGRWRLGPGLLLMNPTTMSRGVPGLGGSMRFHPDVALSHVRH